MTTSDNEWERVVQRMKESDNEWYSKYQRMTTSDNEWQRMTTSNKNDNEWMTAGDKTNEYEWE